MVVEDAASSKDEITSQEEMLNIMSSINNSSAGPGTGTGDVTSADGLFPQVEDGVEIPTPTTSSIRRRASMFGATQKKSSRNIGGESKSKTAQGAPLPPKMDFFGELKLKAKKVKGEGDETGRGKELGKASSTSRGGGGMAGFLSELQNSAKKKQSRRNSTV